MYIGNVDGPGGHALEARRLDDSGCDHIILDRLAALVTFKILQSRIDVRCCTT